MKTRLNKGPAQYRPQIGRNIENIECLCIGKVGASADSLKISVGQLIGCAGGEKEENKG